MTVLLILSLVFFGIIAVPTFFIVGAGVLSAVLLIVSDYQLRHS